MQSIDRKYATILNIRLSSTTIQGVLRFVQDAITRGHKFSIVTPNPEIVLEAQSDPRLASALTSADISLPDGVGLIFAAKFLGQQPLNLLKGREIFLELISLANKKGWRVFLLGGEKGVSEKAAEKLKLNYKKIQVMTEAGPVLDKNGEAVSSSDQICQVGLIRQINAFSPQILFVGFGCPKQEKWVTKWLSKLEIGGAMVVGGTFDFIAGRTQLPPKWMEKLGLEWLWRVFTKPGHVRRVLEAVFLFPLKVFLYRVRNC